MSMQQNAEITQSYSIAKITTLMALSIIFMILSGYISQQFFADFTRFGLSDMEKLIVVIATSIGLPIAAFIMSQTFISTRGIKNGVKAIYYGSIGSLIASIPMIFKLLENTTT